MEKSDSIAKLATALVAFQASMKNVTKDGANPFFKSKYATLENIIITSKPHLKDNGLSFAQFPSQAGLTTVLMHESGEFISSDAPIFLKEHTPQAQGSAITYMRRYALSAALGIATDDDDDGNVASAPAKRQEAPKAAQTAKPKKDEATLRKEAAKERIVTLLKKLGKPTDTKKECEDGVFELTGYLLADKDFDVIGEKLAEQLNAIT